MTEFETVEMVRRYAPQPASHAPSPPAGANILRAG